MIILAILITIFLIVGIHEFGHFITAKVVGIKVVKFSIGFGKSFFRCHDKKGTEYALGIIPLGGYVKFLDESDENISPEDYPFVFHRQPIYKRIAVILAGPLFNFIFAFLLYGMLYWIGFTTVIPLIGKILPHSIAESAGVKPQQEIIRVDNTACMTWTKVVLHVVARTGDKNTMRLDVKNPVTNAITTYQLPLANWKMDNLKPDPLTSLGIIPYEPPDLHWPKKFLRHIQYPFMQSIPNAFSNTMDLINLNLLLFGKLITGKISLKSLGGPITIFQSAGDALNAGVIPFISFLAFFSIAIGVINLLPIPGLDGGHLFFQLIEFIFRRPIPMRLQILSYQLGMTLLILILIQALMNDVLRL